MAGEVVVVMVVVMVMVAGQPRHLRDGVGGVALLVPLVHAPRQLLEQRAELAKVEVADLRVERVVVVELLLSQRRR